MSITVAPSGPQYAECSTSPGSTYPSIGPSSCATPSTTSACIPRSTMPSCSCGWLCGGTVAPASNSIRLIIASVAEERAALDTPSMSVNGERRRSGRTAAPCAGCISPSALGRKRSRRNRYRHADDRPRDGPPPGRRPTSTAPGSTPTPARRSPSSIPRRARRSRTSRAWARPRRGARSRRRERALPAWKHRTAKDRARILRRLADLMLERADDLAALLVREQGKPLAEAKLEIGYAASFYEWFGEEAKRLDGRRDPAAAARPADRRAPAADRRHRGDHAVELPRRDADAQVGSCARRRLHDGAEAGRADAAVGARGRRARRGGGRAAGRVLDRHGRRRRRPADRRRDDLQPDRPQARLHRLDRGRQAADGPVRRPGQEGLARARRQRAVHRLRRRRPRARRSRAR